MVRKAHEMAPMAVAFSGKPEIVLAALAAQLGLSVRQTFRWEEVLLAFSAEVQFFLELKFPFCSELFINGTSLEPRALHVTRRILKDSSHTVPLPCTKMPSKLNFY